MNEPNVSVEVISSSPDVMGGAAVFAGTRVPIASQPSPCRAMQIIDESDVIVANVEVAP